MTTEKRIEKGISEIVGVFTDPILVFLGGWGDTLPEWLRSAITLERLEMNVRSLGGEEATGTDAEACAYLYTASLTAPIDSDWSQIYLYVASKTYSRHKGSQVPDDIRVEALSDYQIYELNRLKTWLCHQRTRVRQERERTERRQTREEETARQKAEQPALFEF